MKTFKLLFGLTSFMLLSFGVSAQNLDIGNDGVGIGVEVADIGEGVDMNLPNDFNFRSTGLLSLIGRNFEIPGLYERTGNSRASSIGFTNGGNINFYTQNFTPSGNLSNFWKISMQVDFDGKVKIGENIGVNDKPDGYKLYVQTGILTEKVKVATVDGGNWADYVFEPDYDLNPISKVETFIKANKHLPNVPSAKEVEANGVDMVEMDATLLRQVEELWLHTIDLNKDKETLQEENETLTKEVNTLQTQNEVLTEQVQDLSRQFEVLFNKVKALETQP